MFVGSLFVGFVSAVYVVCFGIVYGFPNLGKLRVFVFQCSETEVGGTPSFRMNPRCPPFGTAQDRWTAGTLSLQKSDPECRAVIDVIRRDEGIEATGDFQWLEKSDRKFPIIEKKQMADFRTLEKRIGYRFKDKRRLCAALTHPSFRYENPETTADNQRLEFLGDSVLGLLAADALTKNNPDAAEGELTQMKSALTSGAALARAAALLELGSHLQMGRGETANGGAVRESNLEDALEALLGAIWLDGGLRTARRFFERHVFKVLGDQEPALLNPKGTLQEFSQKRGWSIPDYRVVEESGPDHARHYTVEVCVDTFAYRGEGASRREAEKHAAEKAVKSLL